LATSYPYPFVVKKTAADIALLATYQGDSVILRDENGRTWSWNGVGYTLGEDAAAGAQDSLSPPSTTIPPSTRVVAEAVAPITQLQATSAQNSATIAAQAGVITALLARLTAVESAILPPGSGALTLTAPSMTGPLGVGNVLTFVSGTVGGGTAVNTAWTLRRSGAIVYQGPAAPYTQVTADGGTTLSLSQSVVNAAGQTTTATSTNYTIPAAPAVPVMSTPPTVSGTAASGQTLTGVHGTYTNSTGITYGSYQWKNGTTVYGTALTLLVTDAMIGLSFTFSEIATNGAGPSVRATSAAVIVSGGTTPVNIVPPGWDPASVFAVGGVGIPNAGEWSGNPDPSLDLWGYLRDGVPISGATGKSITFTSLDQDKTITPTLIRKNAGSSPSALAQGAGEWIAAGSGGIVVAPTPTSTIGTITAADLAPQAVGTGGYRLLPNLAGIVNRTSGVAITHRAIGGNLYDSPSPYDAISFTSGAPTASGSVTTGLVAEWGLSGSGIEFTYLAVPAGAKTLKVPVVAYALVVAVTVAPADGSAAPKTFNVDAGSASGTALKTVLIPINLGATTDVIVSCLQTTLYAADAGDAHFMGAWL